MTLATIAVVVVVLVAVLHWTRHKSDSTSPDTIAQQVRRRMQAISSSRQPFNTSQLGQQANGGATEAEGTRRAVANAAHRMTGDQEEAAAPARRPRAAASHAAESLSAPEPSTVLQGERLITGRLTATPMATVHNMPALQIETLTIPALSMLRDPTRTLERNGELGVFQKDTLRAEVNLQWPAIGISIWAHGDPARGEWPEVQVWLGGMQVADFAVDSAQEREYFFPCWVSSGQSVLEISYVNDFWDPRTRDDRNVYIRQVSMQLERSLN